LKRATKRQPQNFFKFTDSAGLPVNSAKPAEPAEPADSAKPVDSDNYLVTSPVDMPVMAISLTFSATFHNDCLHG